FGRRKFGPREFGLLAMAESSGEHTLQSAHKQETQGKKKQLPKQKAPAIVAELGRPETPEETAARKAENSRKHRANQTLINLVYSLVATLAVVLLLVLVVVRPDPPAAEPVDYADIASRAQINVNEPLLVPDLAQQWRANNAELRTGNDSIDAWYIGFLTPSDQFVAFTQGIDANPTWLAALLTGNQATGSEIIDGVEWQVFDYREVDNPGNRAYAMTTVSGASTFVLYGTADPNEFRTLASAVSADIATATAEETAP
ncbi:MAG: DUF4245 domain-containing protein, partial [Microbacteriaceae bacterium]